MNDREWEDFATEVMLCVEYGEIETDPATINTEAKFFDALKQQHKREIKRYENGKYAHWDSVQSEFPGSSVVNAYIKTQCGEGPIITFYYHPLPLLEYLQKILGSEIRLPCRFQKKLGIEISYQKLTLWNKRHVAWQTAAQLIGHEKGEFNITHIAEEMLKTNRLCDFLDLGCLTSVKNKESRGRGLDDVIRKVNPTSPKQKPGRPRQQGVRFPTKEIVLVPLVVSKDSKLNLQRFRFLFRVLSRILCFQDNTFEQIILHPIICKYKTHLPPILEKIVHLWIKSSMKENGGLFEK